VEARIEESSDAALGGDADLRDSGLHAIERHGDGLAVEVAAVHDALVVGQEERVVGDRVELRLDHSVRGRKLIHDGAEDLRDATERVRVLPGSRAAAAIDQRAAANDLQHDAGHRLVAGVRAGRGEGKLHRVDVAAERLESHGRGERRRPDQVIGARGEQGGDAGVEGGPVDERDALPVGGGERRESGLLQGDGRRRRARAARHASLAEHREGDLRQLDEVAARPDRAHLAHERMHAGVEHAEQEVHGRGIDARMAEREHVGARHHGRSHEGRRMRRTERGGVAAHEVALKLLARVGGDRLRRERPAARGQAVNRGAGVGEVLYEDVTARDPRPGVRCEHRRPVETRNRVHGVRRERPAPDLDRRGIGLGLGAGDGTSG